MNTKLIVALVVFGVLTVSLVGLVSAQVASSPSPSDAQSVNGFVGWVGNCFRFNGAPGYGTQCSAAQNQPANTGAPNPYINTAPQQGYDGYGDGCKGRFLP